MDEGVRDSSSDSSVELTTERRRWPRETATSNPAVGRARLLAHVSYHYPSLRPNGWYKVVGENPQALEPRARKGYLWIEVDGRPRQTWTAHFEVVRATSR